MSMPSSPHTTSHPGRFGDGKTAGTAAVTVGLTDRGIEIGDVPGATGTLIWPYGALAIGSPLASGTDHVLVSYEHQKGATLFVDGHGFAAELASRAPHLTARSARLRHAGPWLWAFAAVAALAGLIWAMNLSPSHALAHLMPDRVRTALGLQVVGSMTRGRKVCELPAGRAAVDKLVARLTGVAGGRKPFTVTVVDWGLVNAFAAPGEQIVLTRGLINKADGPDEVAGVLAHEIGHGLELHPETGIVRAIGLSAAIELMAGGNAGTLANIGVLLAQFSYTRAAEREADAHALRMLKEAAISPQGIIDFFTRFQKKDESGTGQFDILRTHPQMAERKAAAEAVPRYASTPALNADEWQALRAICGKE